MTPDDSRAHAGVATIPPAVLMSERPSDTRDEEGSSPLDLAEWVDVVLAALS